MMIDEETYGKLTPKQALKIVKEIRREEVSCRMIENF